MQYSYTVKVPRQFNATLNTSGGSLTVRTLDGSGQGKTAGSSIQVEEIEGPVDARTSGGDGEPLRATGTMNGGGPTIELETQGGSIRIEHGQYHVVAAVHGPEKKGHSAAFFFGRCNLPTLSKTDLRASTRSR